MYTATALNEHENLLIDEHKHGGAASQPNVPASTPSARVQRVDRFHA